MLSVPVLNHNLLYPPKWKGTKSKNWQKPSGIFLETTTTKLIELVPDCLQLISKSRDFPGGLQPEVSCYTTLYFFQWVFREDVPDNCANKSCFFPGFFAWMRALGLNSVTKNMCCPRFKVKVNSTIK